MPLDRTCRTSGAVALVSLALLTTESSAVAEGGCPPSGSAGTWTWDGGGDGTYWSDADNWTPNSVPPSGADVVINDASGAVVIKHPANLVTVQTLACSGMLVIEWVPSAGPVLTILDCATIDTLIFDVPRIDAGYIAGAPGAELTVTNHLLWQNGSIVSGLLVRIAQGATATLLGSKGLSACTFEVDGVVTIDGGELRVSDGAIFHNDNDGQTSCGSVGSPPGLVEIRNNGVIVDYGGSPQIINDGCWQTDGTGLAATVNAEFVNDGQLDIISNTRLWLTDATCDGSISVADDSILDLADVAGGSLPGFVSTPNSSIDCAATGTIRCYSAGTTMNITISGSLDVQGTWQQSPPGVGSGATVTFNGTPKHFANYYYGGGGLGGNASIMIAEHMDWVNDPISVALVSIPAGADLDIMASSKGGGAKHLFAAMEVTGTVKVHANASVNFWCGGGTCSVGVLHILPGGRLELDNNCGFSGGLPTNVGSVLNEGIVTTLAGHATSNFFLPFTNAGELNVTSGTIQFARSFTQTAGGQTILAGGSLESVWYWYPSFVLNGGVLRGNGTIVGDVANNAGTIACGDSPGTITVTGNYQQGPAGMLAVELAGVAAGTQYDQLEVTGTASLNGSMTVSLIDGFVPNVGDTFTVLSAGVIAGSLSQCCYLDPFFHIGYEPTTVDLMRVAPCPNDIVCNRAVDVDDLVAVILAWGPYQAPSTTCSVDVFPVGGDSQVDTDDLVSVILSWGPCP